MQSALFKLTPLAGCLAFGVGLLASVAPVCAQLNNPAMTGLWVGEDITTLPVSEQQGFKFYDAGTEGTFFDVARRNGWNIMRVRLWVAPDAKPESAAADLDHVTLLGKRIKAAGFQFLLDLHYSDTWADPGHQKKPAAWADLDFPALVQQVHDYSRDVIAHLRASGAMPDVVQVGNETKYGLLYGGGVNGAGPAPGGPEGAARCTGSPPPATPSSRSCWPPSSPTATIPGCSISAWPSPAT